MRIRRVDRRTILSGLFIGTLVLLCGVLGLMQFKWNGEVSAALYDRLHASLSDNLRRLSRDLNAEISAPCSSLTPPSPRDRRSAQAEVLARFAQWKGAARRPALLRRIGFAWPEGDHLALDMLDMDRVSFASAAWPDEWKNLRDRLLRIGRLPMRGAHLADEGTVFEQPLFPSDWVSIPPPAESPGFGRPELGWIIFDVDLAYIRDTLLPEVLQRHLGSGGSLDYQVEVVNRFDPAQVIYRSDAGATDLASTADASAPLFDVSWPRRAARGSEFWPGRRDPDAPALESGRWLMYVRHKAGSLEAVVAQTRRRNLGVTGGVLLLMLATVAAWVRFTRRAQRLAELQMDFVAGVSHELRTPLTVIHTAGYNLQGKLSGNPAQVERYGKLIQQESGRLKDIVEQVLQFSSAKAGSVIQQGEPLEVEDLIDQAIEASRAGIEAAHCVVEKRIETGLPPVHADARALRLALENLLGNAAKYGSKGSGWIGVFAVASQEKSQRMVEIHVSDRGPGIPSDEQKHVFDPFFRGRRAVKDQVHGTGLGLSLVKKIVEAHGGRVAVRSVGAQGTEFIVRIPAIGAGI